MGDGWIDPEGDRVVFYIHTEKVDEGKVRRMSPRPLTDIVSYDMMLETGEVMIQNILLYFYVKNWNLIGLNTVNNLFYYPQR